MEHRSTFETKTLLLTVLIQAAVVGVGTPLLLPPAADRLERIRDLPGLTRGIFQLGHFVRDNWMGYAGAGALLLFLLLLCEWKVPWRDAVAKQYCFLIFCFTTLLALELVGLALPFYLGLV